MFRVLNLLPKTTTYFYHIDEKRIPNLKLEILTLSPNWKCDVSDPLYGAKISSVFHEKPRLTRYGRTMDSYALPGFLYRRPRTPYMMNIHVYTPKPAEYFLDEAVGYPIDYLTTFIMDINIIFKISFLPARKRLKKSIWLAGLRLILS